MSKRNKENVYRTEGDITYIDITNRHGEVRTTLVDTEDVDKIKNFYKFSCYYANNTDSYYIKSHVYQGIVDGKPKYKNLSLHRFVMEAKEGEVIDHINHDSLDNRKENLRRTNTGDNIKNRKSKSSNNTSGYRNVCWDKSRNKWIVQIQVNKKNKVLGEFKDVHEAGRFAEEMRQLHYGEFAGRS